MRGKKLAQKKLKNTGNPVFIGKQNDIPTRTRHFHNLARYHWPLHLKDIKIALPIVSTLKRIQQPLVTWGLWGFIKRKDGCG